MLQSGGTLFVLFPASHDTLFEVLKNIAHDSRFAPYLQVSVYTVCIFVCSFSIKILIVTFTQNLNKYIPSFYNSVLPSEDLKDLLGSVGFNVQHCSLREIDFSEINEDTFLS